MGISLRSEKEKGTLIKFDHEKSMETSCIEEIKFNYRKSSCMYFGKSFSFSLYLSSLLAVIRSLEALKLIMKELGKLCAFEMEYFVLFLHSTH